MSLRARLIAAFAVLLVVALAAVAFIGAGSTRRVLVAQVDEELRATVSRLSERGGSRDAVEGRAEVLVARPAALFTVDDLTGVVASTPSGFADDPDALPAQSQIVELVDSPGEIATVSTEDGSLEYRALAVDLGDGTFRVAALPIDHVDEATNDLVRWLIAGGTAVALLGALATALVVRRGLRPVSAMVDTAALIAAGDMTERVTVGDPRSELGQLSTALNDMLGRIDEAFGQERAAQAQLNQFVADASHELRTPLAAVQGYVELFRRGGLNEPDELAAAMGRIRTESGRMQRLVDDLLLLAQLDRGQRFENTDVDLAGLVGDAVANSEAIEPDRPVRYEGPDRLIVGGDESRLAQVFANLLSNARTHTPAGSPVEIKLSDGADSVRVDVIDTGPGVAEDDVDRLFDRFYRSEHRRPGSGLGLAIVAAIVEAHGGEVAVANEPGRGARFIVSLPR